MSRITKSRTKNEKLERINWSLWKEYKFKFEETRCWNQEILNLSSLIYLPGHWFVTFHQLVVFPNNENTIYNNGRLHFGQQRRYWVYSQRAKHGYYYGNNKNLLFEKQRISNWSCYCSSDLKSTVTAGRKNRQNSIVRRKLFVRIVQLSI